MLSSFSSSFFAGRRGGVTARGKGSFAFVAANNTYLSVPASADWTIASNTDYTLEWWAYQTNNGNENYVWSLGTGNTFAASIASGGGRVNFYFGGSRIANPTVNGSLQNVWVHFAIARSGTSLRLFQDGALLTTVTDSTAISDSTSTLHIGVNDPAGNTNDNWPGDLANIHFVKGTALYTAAFTKPTAQPEAVANSKLLLYPQSSALLTTDSSGTNKTVTNNNGVTYSSLSPV